MSEAGPAFDLGTGSREEEIAAWDFVTLDRLADDLARVVHFPRKEDFILAILWASQSWLGPEVLPEKCLAYLTFIGPKSSGKTTATEAICQITVGIAGALSASQ